MSRTVSESDKQKIREDILNATPYFRDYLSGKYFLYIFDNRYIEVMFKTINFCHLTGVATHLTAQDFYKKVKKRQLDTNQFFFNKEHQFDLAKKKSSELYKLKDFTCTDVFILEEINTDKVEFKFGFTNIDNTLCLSENIDKKTGIKINDIYLPQSFRVKDKSFENSKNRYEVDFIFMKDNIGKKYSNLIFGNLEKIGDIQSSISKLIKLDESYIQNEKFNHEAALTEESKLI